MKETSIFRILAGFLTLLGFVAIFSTVLSPPVFWGIDKIWPDAVPFKRVFNRMLLLSALAGLWPLARYWGIASWRKLGLRDPRFWSESLLGFVVGALVVIVLAGLPLVLGFREWITSSSWLKLGEFALAAVAIALAEEILFRGFFFWALKDFFGRWFALWAVFLSACFADLHFLKAKDLAGEVTWLSGWQTWLHIFPNDIMALLPSWTTIFLLGLLLCAMVWKRGSLWGAIGLHAGVVCGLKSSRHLTRSLEENFWFSADLLTGLIPAVLLVLMLIVVLSGQQRRL